MKKKQSVFNSVVYGLFEGGLIFTGVYLITIIYLRPSEINLPIEQALTNIDIYFPLILNKLSKQKILDRLNRELIKTEERSKENKIKFNKKNKKIKRTFNLIFIIASSIILFLLLIIL